MPGPDEVSQEQARIIAGSRGDLLGFARGLSASIDEQLAGKIAEAKKQARELTRRPIWLRKETRSGLDYAVVLVQDRRTGIWCEVIKELIGARTENEFSHIWEDQDEKG